MNDTAAFRERALQFLAHLRGIVLNSSDAAVVDTSVYDCRDRVTAERYFKMGFIVPIKALFWRIPQLTKPGHQRFGP